MKESWPSKRQRLHDKKQTSTPASDNKWNKESSAGGTQLNVDSCVWRFEKLSSILFSIEFSLSMIILRDVEDSVSCSSTISSRFRFGVGAEFELELDDRSCRLDVSVAAYIIYKVDYASTTTILCHKEEPNGLFQRFGYRAVEGRPAAILQPVISCCCRVGLADL